MKEEFNDNLNEETTHGLEIDFDTIDASVEENNVSNSFADKINKMKGSNESPVATESTEAKLTQEVDEDELTVEQLHDEVEDRYDDYFKDFAQIEDELRKINIVNQPKKLKYKPGEQISYEGIKLEFEGKDITDEVTYSVAQGTPWNKSDKTLDVTVKYVRGEEVFACVITLKKKSNMLPIFAILLALLIACGVGGYMLMHQQDQGQPSEAEEVGSYLIPQGEMTDEEARAMLDEQVEKSRITVSVSPNMKLKSDGTLRVNFVVPEPNNGFSERLEVTQDGKVVYSSEIVNPGYKIEWGQSNGAVAGSATATVHAVDESGQDSGNPVSVEIQIVNEG